MRNYKTFKALVVMVQKEVAQRLYAKGRGTKFYGRTSVLVQANATVEEKFEVCRIISFQTESKFISN